MAYRPDLPRWVRGTEVGVIAVAVPPVVAATTGTEEDDIRVFTAFVSDKGFSYSCSPVRVRDSSSGTNHNQCTGEQVLYTRRRNQQPPRVYI